MVVKWLFVSLLILRTPSIHSKYVFVHSFYRSVAMHLFRILLLASVIAVTLGFPHWGDWGDEAGEEDLCVNDCLDEDFFYTPVCEWDRRRQMGITMWSTKATRRQKMRQFCSSCPNPTSCLPEFMQ